MTDIEKKFIWRSHYPGDTSKRKKYKYEHQKRIFFKRGDIIPSQIFFK